MDIWFLFQIALNLVLVGGLAVVWTKLKRPPQDDPRLSRGLQLLQSKISVLEDLSDRTDKQVEQLTKLLEQKTRQLQTKTFEAEKLLQKVDQSMHRSLEVAEIFQDKIPHSEIIERQNTVKYVLAAQLSHKGLSVDEIAAKVDLPKEQIEFISKVNKDQLMFDAEQLPPWAKTQLEKIDRAEELSEVEFDFDAGDYSEPHFSASELSNLDFEDIGTEENETDEWDVTNTKEMSSLKKLGEEFRQACVEFDVKQQQFEEEEKQAAEPSKIAQAAQKVSQKIIESSSELLTTIQAKVEQSIDAHPAPEIPKAASEKPVVAPASDRKFLPLQPEIKKPTPAILKTKVHSASLRSDSSRMQTKEVPNSEIKKVLFPRIDLDDHLG